MHSKIIALTDIYLRIRTLLFAILFAGIGNSCLYLLIPVNLEASGVSTTVSGIIMSGYPLGMLIISRFGNNLVYYAGHMRGYIVGASLMIIIASLHMFFSDAVLSFTFRLIAGGGMGLIYLTLEGWLNATSESHSRGRIYSLYQICLGLGFIIGPFIASFMALDDKRVYGIATIFYCLSFIPLVLSLKKTPEIDASAAIMPIREMLWDSPSGSIGVFFCGIVQSGLVALSSLYGISLGYSGAFLSMLLSAIFFGSLIFQFPTGWLADRVDRRILLLVLTLIFILSTIALALRHWFEFPDYLLLALLSLAGGTVYGLYPVCITSISVQLEPNKLLAAMGSIMVIYGAGAILGPIILTPLMDYIGSEYLFYQLTLIGLFYAVFLMQRIIRFPVPSDDFESLPYTLTMQMLQPGNSSLDPRLEYTISLTESKIIKTLAQSIAISPRKSVELIEQTKPYIDYQNEYIILALVTIKPRYTYTICNAMVSLYPDERIKMFDVLIDVIRLNRKLINNKIKSAMCVGATDDEKLYIENRIIELTNTDTESTNV